MTDDQIIEARKLALELAVRSHDNSAASDVVAAAEKYAAFLTGPIPETNPK